MASPSPARGPTLRIVAINDVYTLQNLPRLRTLIQRARETDPADVLITSLAGDFVGPSMLGSLDSGRGMVDCMNALPITHVVLGNHEADIGPEALHARIEELQGTLISTNVVGFDPKAPPAQILEVGGAGKRTVRVGILGVVMEDPTVYARPPFGGVPVLPANEAVRRAAARLIEEGCAAVIPITHQTVEADRDLCRHPGRARFPVVVGGHEHTVLTEPIEGTWLVKAGCDASHAVVVDLVWPAEAPAAGVADRPEVRVRIEDVIACPEDAALRAKVDGHMRAVEALAHATLFTAGAEGQRQGAALLAPGETLSSVGTRARQTSLGRVVTSLLRDALGAEACVMNGGGIRGSKDYPTRFTYGDLEAEVPFDNEIVVAALPGRVIEEAVAASRSHAPAEWGGFLQVDDGMAVEGADLRSIAGRPIDADRDYRVALVRNLFDGMDHIDPLVRFAKDHPDRIPPAGSGRDIKLVLVEAFSRALWDQIGPFDALDEDHDGFVDAREIADAIARVTAEPASPITVDLLVKAIDADHDRRISREDAATAAFAPSRGS